ncbi:hypothetical protein CCUS01_11900 [Colletotrichum cuscutae]|uniref:Uncharacterized protein n=1 Tax=Colletotrichum cuscutae TaxID=1209917 RepID=A0AAI9U0P2_9PEZI|nr:hypothetical protein CCUS01_11900 [Colletotrichum cuscutae]
MGSRLCTCREGMELQTEAGEGDIFSGTDLNHGIRRRAARENLEDMTQRSRDRGTQMNARADDNPSRRERASMHPSDLDGDISAAKRVHGQFAAGVDLVHLGSQAFHVFCRSFEGKIESMAELALRYSLCDSGDTADHAKLENKVTTFDYVLHVGKYALSQPKVGRRYLAGRGDGGGEGTDGHDGQDAADTTDFWQACHFQHSRGLSVPVFNGRLSYVSKQAESSPAPQSGILNCHPSKAECQVQVASRKDQNTNLKQWGSGVHSSMRETRREQKKKKKSKGDLRSMRTPYDAQRKERKKKGTAEEKTKTPNDLTCGECDAIPPVGERPGMLDPCRTSQIQSNLSIHSPIQPSPTGRAVQSHCTIPPSNAHASTKQHQAPSRKSTGQAKGTNQGQSSTSVYCLRLPIQFNSHLTPDLPFRSSTPPSPGLSSSLGPTFFLTRRLLPTSLKPNSIRLQVEPAPLFSSPSLLLSLWLRFKANSNTIVARYDRLQPRRTDT